MGFRENLKSELEYSGMLVKELAAKSGVKKHSIDKYLSARGQTPSVEIGVKLAKALGVSVEYLVTGEDERTHTTPRSSGTLRLIGRCAERLDEKKRGFVLEFIKWLLSRGDEAETL
jgi:transcriptional regulator with XRE-family HTH domain